MLNRVLSCIQPELQKTQDIQTKSYQIRSGHLSSYVHLVPGHFHDVIRPAMVLLSVRLFSPVNNQAIALAAVVQFIYLAAWIHKGVGENAGSLDSWNGYQFPVLVGDYLYGRFFTSLCEAGIVRYLHPLAKIICTMSEGSLLRLKDPDVRSNPSLLEEMVYKETAALFGESCRLGADLAQAPGKMQEILHRFGLNVGMAIGMEEYQVNGDAYLDEAKNQLALLPANETKNTLEQLIQYLRNQELALGLRVG